MSTYRNLITLCAAAVLTLGLAACGGGGGTAPTTGETDAAEMEMQALSDAQAAAKRAWQMARDALAGIAGKEDANPAAAQRAMNAVADAKAAYDDAVDATTSAVAERHQEDAEAANQIAQAQTAAVIASYEAPALERAQMAAKSAAEAAKQAYMEAKDAVAGVDSIQGSDTASYNTAVAKRDAAKAASDAANEAYMDAKATMVLEDAQTHQGTAEDALEDANTANTEAMKYAGMVQTAEDEALMDAKDAAQRAYDMAKKDYDAAKKRVADLADKKGADPDNEVRARDALGPVGEAYMAASAANDEAQKATTSVVARGHADDAETEQGRVATLKQSVDTYAGLVEDAYDSDQQVADREKQRQADVADARNRAMASYIAADGDATKAEGQADAAEATAPGTPGAMAARKAATDARTAANAAKAAHDAIMDEMTKEQADLKATEAADEAGKANSGYMTAKLENEDIQTNAGQIAENERKNAIADARKYGGVAVDNAKTAADDANTAAGEAKTAYETAKSEHMRAVEARTNADQAEKQADAAKTAYEAAKQAAGDANDAYEAAKAAIDGVTDESTKEEADTARSTAETQEGLADGHKTTAMTQQTAAEDARDMAMDFANDHVVGLLVMANAEHISRADDPDANLDETELELIRKNKNAHIAMVNTAVKTANDDSTDPSHGGGTVRASYPYYASLGVDGAFGGTGEDADTGPGAGVPAILLTPDTTGGTAVGLIHAGPGTDGEAGTDDDVSANFVLGPGLGDFVHEKYFGRDNDTNTNDMRDAGDTSQRIILFTDIEQATEPTLGETVSYFGEPVVQSRIATVDTATPVEDTERDYNATYDHDGIAGTAPIAVVLNCGTSCNLRVVNGEIVSISGYTFSTAGDVTVPGVAPVADDTWLAFGIWLTETVVADGVNTYVFGAFADGGDAVESADNIGEVTGDATYTGKAAGVHSTATAVDFFHADATLNAKFGDGTATGTITGMIHNIVAAGRSVDDSIELVVSDPGAADPSPNIDADGGFDGRARMMNTGEQDSSGEDIYRYTGTWTGNFYNHMEDDTDTANIDEASRAPGSVAGTFGVGRADAASTTDVDETESYVGAFGAHCSGSNCNPN